MSESYIAVSGINSSTLSCLLQLKDFNTGASLALGVLYTHAVFDSPGPSDSGVGKIAICTNASSSHFLIHLNTTVPKPLPASYFSFTIGFVIISLMSFLFSAIFSSSTLLSICLLLRYTELGSTLYLYGCLFVLYAHLSSLVSCLHIRKAQTIL